jgi:hypothetical protein
MTRHKSWGIVGTLAVGGALAVSALVGGNEVGAQTPQPHWGPYKWSGGSETAAVRAFYLLDRTGNQAMHDAIGAVANGWNSARTAHPELPFVAVQLDDANVGRCFINAIPGWSIASACSIQNNIDGVNGLAGRNADAQGHLTGAAISIRDGLSAADTFTVACRTIGQIIGLPTSANPASCMSGALNNTSKWLVQADADAVLALYNHQDPGGPIVTSTTTTSTTMPASTSTTSTTVPASTSTSSTSTSTSTSITIPITIP